MGLYSNNIDFFIEQIFVGFGLTILFISIIVTFSIDQGAVNFFKRFRDHAIETIRIAGIIGLCWFFIYIIIASTEDTRLFRDLFDSSKSGYLRFAIWAILLRFPVLFGLTQLFWIEKMRSRVSYRNSIAFLIIFVALFHGAFLEKLLIFMTNIHRDYLPSDYSMFDDNFWQYAFYLIYKSFMLFIPMVLIQWGISMLINRFKRKNV